MNNLANQLINIINGGNFVLSGRTCKDSGKIFSLTEEDGFEVVAIRVDGGLISGAVKKCDCLYFIISKETKLFYIVLVELKGNDVGQAVKQLISTKEQLRLMTSCGSGYHIPKVRLHEEVEQNRLVGHGGKLFGIIASTRGLPQSQKEKARLRKNEHIVLVSAKKAQGLKPSEIINRC